MKKTVIATILLALASPVFAFNSVEEVMQDLNAKGIVLLKAYIAEHPDAKDRDDADQMLVSMLMSGSGPKDEAIKLLEAKYEKLTASKDKADLRDLLGGCLAPLIHTYLESGHKDKAAALIERAEKDWAGDNNIDTIKKTLDSFKKQLSTPGVGETMEIKFKSVDGRDVDLAALKDKVVLIDFWATWCGPCVHELPNVKAAYDKFHEKGFEVIAISLDDDKEKLENFVKKENMPWPQSFSGDGWSDALAKKFGISSIPAMFLIGKDGKIAAINTRGPGALEAKLAELLK